MASWHSKNKFSPSSLRSFFRHRESGASNSNLFNTAPILGRISHHTRPSILPTCPNRPSDLFSPDVAEKGPFQPPSSLSSARCEQGCACSHCKSRDVKDDEGENEDDAKSADIAHPADSQAVTPLLRAGRSIDRILHRMSHRASLIVSRVPDVTKASKRKSQSPTMRSESRHQTQQLPDSEPNEPGSARRLEGSTEQAVWWQQEGAESEACKKATELPLTRSISTAVRKEARRDAAVILHPNTSRQALIRYMSHSERSVQASIGKPGDLELEDRGDDGSDDGIWYGHTESRQGSMAGSGKKGKEVGRYQEPDRLPPRPRWEEEVAAVHARRLELLPHQSEALRRRNLMRLNSSERKAQEETVAWDEEGNPWFLNFSDFHCPAPTAPAVGNE